MRRRSDTTVYTRMFVETRKMSGTKKHIREMRELKKTSETIQIQMDWTPYVNALVIILLLLCVIM